MSMNGLRATCLLATFIGSAAWAAGPTRPNIVMLLADDLGWKDLGCQGCADVRTPRIDAMARQGVRFTWFYSNGTECTPTRAALLTGRHPQRPGGLECAIGSGNVGRYDDAIRLRETDDLGLPPTRDSLASRMRAAGYATALFGKWHLGYAEKFSPSRHGFEHALYGLGGGMDYFHHVDEGAGAEHVLRLDGARHVRTGEYFTDLVADEAVSFVGMRRDAPFLLFVPFTAPHAPYQGPQDRRDAPLPPDSPLWRQDRAPHAVYAAMIESLDAAVGRILDALDRAAAATNTLVIFTSDNGGTRSARPTGLRGFKGTTFEGGIRVPCIVRWPGVLAAGATCDAPAQTIDLTASILRAAGAATNSLDGRDVLGDLASGRAIPGRTLFWRGRRGEKTWRAVRDGPLKYVSLQTGAGLEEHLFDLAGDPGETNDLLAARGSDAVRLKERLEAWAGEVRPRRPASSVETPR
jgi:N-acetylgalactosamine-6-sulfatase